jgi:hypothetical protein
MLNVVLSFRAVCDDIEGAAADIHVEDAHKIEASSQHVSSQHIEPESTDQSDPTMTLDVDVSLPIEDHEISLSVRIEVYVKSTETINVLHSSPAPLSGNPDEV